MKNRLVAIIILAFCTILPLSGCLDVNPITGRTQLSLVSSESLREMSFTEYDTFIKQNKLSTDAQATAMVKRCGQRIASAVDAYCRQNGWEDRLAGFSWEFNLVEDSQVNAFCMPGGKVAVYTGILPITRDEAGLAAVVAHEIAHAVAQHSKERMSQAMVVSLGGLVLERAMKEKEAKTKSVFLGLYGAGSSVGYMLPNSRKQELEADRLGLKFMAMAGYDPHAAEGVWQRMSANGGAGVPEFLSTHPTDARRLQQIRDLMPEAEKFYK